MVIGHRGYVYPAQSRLLENTLLAYEQAWKNGAEGVELDIHLTKDDQLVCYHDFTLKKLGSSDKVQNVTLEELKRIELPEKQKIPTIEEAFDHFEEKLYFNIEIKAPESVYSVMDIIEERDLKNRCLISSFHTAAIKVITKANRGLHAALLYITPWGKIEKAEALKVKTLHPSYVQAPFVLIPLTKMVMNHHINLATNYGYTINAWTINKEKDAISLAKKGVSGIITDDTPLMSQLFSSER